jgi:uncharacterized protein
MNKKLRNLLLKIARQKISDVDPSHDFEHALRVLANAEIIAKEEKADMDILVPSALFHDVINHPKNSPRAAFSSDESAELTKKILEKIKGFPKNKIHKVCTAIKCCSFSKGIVPELLEAKILQDADGLEATGAISIMRTFCSTGQTKRMFYHPDDPFCKKRNPPTPKKYALDLFYARLLKITKRARTKTAKRIAKRRTVFLHKFLKELNLELKGK